MKNFDYSMPTMIHFGKGCIEKLPKELVKYGANTLVVYGGGSVKKSGLLDQVCEIAEANGKRLFFLSGVTSNPKIGSVREGVKLCKENGIELILSVGGGSTLDCCKAIACAAFYDGDPWDIVLDIKKCVRALPVIDIITLAATGSENNSIAVISNDETKEKFAFNTPKAFPAASFLDPEYTFSVPPVPTKAGIADIFAHAFESYYNMDHVFITDKICEGIMQTCVKYGKQIMAEPDNYEARANVMWAASLAMNAIDRLGSDRSVQTSAHSMEHPLSGYYDISHGLGVAVLMPAWLKYIFSDETVPRMADMGRNVFGLSAELSDRDCAREAIVALEEFLTGIGCPLTLWDLGITEDRYFTEMAKQASIRTPNSFIPLTSEDVEKIYRSCWK